jgi:alpha-tubulin suppressor-like RCC1 family protein
MVGDKSEGIISCVGERFECNVLKPISGIENTVVTDVKCGKDHVLALSDQGRVFVWGDNSYGVTFFH